MAKYHISQAALEDLESIWLYTFKKWSKEQAAKYHKEIVEEIKTISKSDKDYGIKYFDVMDGLYCSRCRKHLVFYRYDENEDVEIIRILHNMMDIESKFHTS
ncbi:MAG: type II toxin-antitoxin system RelE/ParE family toxin [Alphaproteobacteria bacterium]|jgi:toxin ParE1/3/4|nr:type II toxin-antitoxin system RelE/ParE family toxin [Bacteroidales bacterium]MBR2200696.1 type II toxin-antitoxin system RelE/ParE family toxin [Bacteroidales bacterium]